MRSFTKILFIGFLFTLFSHAEDKAGHLFILSGQSNMTGNLRKGFQETVSESLKEEEMTIVHCSRSGRGIRFWVTDYSLPKDHPMTGLSQSKSNGEEFTRLVKAVKDACEASKFKTVHLIWMQGESDANRDLGVVYERSFKALVGGLKKELGLEKMHFVIGRITDYGLHSEKKRTGWKGVRDAQQKLGDGDPLGAWINTDDFIAEEVKTKQGDLHYTREESVKLGKRFGEATLKQLKLSKK